MDYPLSAQPPMYGSASALVESSVGGLVRYEITQVDLDTYLTLVGAVLKEVKLPDRSCQIAARRITSMGRYQFTPRGIDDMGKIVWDIVGEAAVRPGAYVDTWALFNNRFPGNVLLDPPIFVSQRVSIKPAQPAPPITGEMEPEDSLEGIPGDSAAFAAPLPDFAINSNDGDHEEAVLANEVVASLSDPERSALMGEQRLVIAMERLPADLGGRVTLFAQHIMEQTNAIMAPEKLLNPNRLNELAIELTAVTPRKLVFQGYAPDGEIVRF